MNDQFDELTQGQQVSRAKAACDVSAISRLNEEYVKILRLLHQTALMTILSLVVILPPSLLAQDAWFTFHGQLIDNGAPASGAYDLEFRLFDQASGGTQQGGVNAFDDREINNGLFTVRLDFGSDVFDGSSRWLEIAVRPGSSGGSFTTLVPRQLITSTPYAIRAAAFEGPVKAAQLTGEIKPENIGDGTIRKEMIAPGSVDAQKLAPGTVIPPQAASGSSVQAQPNTAYDVTSEMEVTIHLPSDAKVGDVVRVNGLGAGGWRVEPAEGQYINGYQPGVFWLPHERIRGWSAVTSSADGSRLVAVEFGGQIYVSGDSGLNWIARENNRNWQSVASSADGSRLVAVDFGVLVGGRIYISTDSGTNWTARENDRSWASVASSEDGSKLVAVESGGRIYTSTDGGLNWDARESNRGWQSVASSADGSKLVAVEFGGRIYTSTDAGLSWIARENSRGWQSVASSADGTRLVAVDSYGTGAGGWIYTSTDSGTNWVTREHNNRHWESVASSVDGMRLVAVVFGGQIYTSVDGGTNWPAPVRYSDLDWTAIASSTDGTKLVAAAAGDRIHTSSVIQFTGKQGSTAELQYVGYGMWQPLNKVPPPMADNQDSSIEVGNSEELGLTPFIDFHYGTGASQDYNVRLINDADGQLSLLGNFRLLGTLIGDGSGLTNLNAASLIGSIPPNSVATAALADGAVTTPKIADGAVTASKIAAGAIGAAQLAAGSVGSSQLAEGAITGEKIAAGSVGKQALADGALSAAKMETTSTWITTTIANPTPDLNDWFGNSAAGLGDNRFVIGAPFDDATGQNSGAAYLFSANGAVLTTFTNPTPVVNERFGYSVASVGEDCVLIGAADPVRAGSAYLFNLGGSLITTITNPAPASGDEFGYAVAAVGNDRVAIGAYYGDTDAPNGGSAYLYSTNGTLLVTFTNPAPGPFEYFGSALAGLGSDCVLIGAPNGTLTGGAVYLYSTDGTLLTTIENPGADLFDNFGFAVASLGNDRVLVSAINADGDAGAVYLFSTNGVLLRKFANPNPTFIDNFGFSLAALGNDRVLIGAPFSDPGAQDAGVAYLFNTDGTLLNTFTNPAPAPSAQFGISVTALNDHVLIGAEFADVGVTHAGAVYLYSTETFTPGLTAESVRAGAVTSASITAGAVTSDHLADSSVGSKQLAKDAVGSQQLAKEAVTAEKLDTTIGVWTRAGDDVFRSDGRVGIGTSTPQTALHVAGTVTAQAFVGDGSGLTNVGGGSGGNYVFAYSTVVQTVAIAGTFQDVAFDMDAQINGWMHSASTASYTNTRAGLYLVQFTAQTDTLAAGQNFSSIRAVLNGVEVPGSHVTTVFQGVAEQILSVSRSFIVNAAAADVFAIQFSGSSTAIRLRTGGTSPSVSMTIIRIQ